eukprot:1969839-Alexandrium_andersonii.AAC.1
MCRTSANAREKENTLGPPVDSTACERAGEKTMRTAAATATTARTEGKRVHVLMARCYEDKSRRPVCRASTD